MRQIGRANIGMAALAILATGGLALALGLGLPDPGVAERAFAGLLGLLGCLLAMRRLGSTAETDSPKNRISAAVEVHESDPPQAPTVEAARNLERALGLGTATIGQFNLMVRPRLQALAAAELAHAGCSLEDRSTAATLLGDGWWLIDPAAPAPEDRMAPGVPLSRVEQLTEALERLQ